MTSIIKRIFRKLRVPLIRITVVTAPTVCTQKVKYTTEKKAKKAVEKQAALERVRYSYKCPHCDGWHLTKEEQWTLDENGVRQFVK